MKITRSSIVLATLTATSLLVTCIQGAVLGIDIGTEWFTIALANPGRPLDLVLNRDANRQTASVVTVNGLERTFGSNAAAIAPRFPKNTFMAVRNLLGVSYDSETAQTYRQQFPNQMVKEPTMGTVAFQYSDNNQTTMLTVQELVAMQLGYAQQLVKESEGIEVKDVVLTVPSFFDRNQRQAMLDAAHLAGLRTLALVNDGSAVALNYAMSRSFPKSEKHLFYDMGAGKTVATVAGFYARSSVSTGATASKAKKSTVINVQSFAADNSLGGMEVDFIVRDLLVNKFATAESLSPEEVRGNARSMNRLLKESKRIKTILSVNNEATASVEGLYKGIDFRTQLTRNELEKSTAHLVPRIRQPIEEALRMANMTIKDIDSIVLVGGGTRVPFVQKALSGVYGTDKLSRNVNAEEACVMGAVFKGATLSSKFRVRAMRLRDAMSYAVRANYPKETKSILGASGTKTETLSLYSPFGAVGSRRVIKDTRDTDLGIEFEYLPSTPAANSKWESLATAKIQGIPEARTKLKTKASVLSEKPEIKIVVQTNELGAFEILKSEALFNVTNPSYALYLEDLAAWEKESSEWQASTADSTDIEEKTEETVSAENKKSKNRSSLRARPAPQPETITEMVPLEVNVEYHSLVQLSKSDMKTSRDLLRRMDDDDKARIARHGAVNSLETLIYHLRDIVEEDDIVAVTTESQRTELIEAVTGSSEWLEDHGETASLDDIQARIDILKKLEKPIVYRQTESSKRSKNIEGLRSIIKQAKALVDLYRASYTEEELAPGIEQLQILEDTLKSGSSWLDDMVAKQDALASSDDPALTIAAMDAKAVEIERSLADLVSKEIKKKTESNSASENEETKVSSEITEETESSTTDVHEEL